MFVQAAKWQDQVFAVGHLFEAILDANIAEWGQDYLIQKFLSFFFSPLFSLHIGY